MLFLEIVIARNIPEKLNCNIDLIDLLYQTNGDNQHYFHNHLAVCQNLVPLVNIKIAGKWMFIPLKMVLIGIDPYPFTMNIMGLYNYHSLSRNRGSLSPQPKYYQPAYIPAYIQTSISQQHHIFLNPKSL